MQVAMKHASAELTKTPTDGKGTFDFVVHAFEIDKDNERVKSFTGLPAELFIGYQHTNNLTRGIQDPGAFIGKAKVKAHPAGLQGSGQLDLANPMGMAVYERMLLPADDPLALNELSIGFAFDASMTSRGEKGELVIPDAALAEISVVHTGSQRTQVMNLKAASLDDSAWDKNQAMGQCNSAADYRSICAGEHSVGTPDERQHWALPHHYLGKAANAAGVAAARARFGQTQDLTNSAAARRHLFETHVLPSDSATKALSDDWAVDELEFIRATAVSMKAGRVLSAASVSKLEAIIATAQEMLASARNNVATEEEPTNGEEPQANPEESGPDAELRQQLAAFIS
jgi:hypothetical protein